MSIKQIGIHPDFLGGESYSDRWKVFLRARDIQTKDVNLLLPDAFNQVQDCQGVMWRWGHFPDHKQSARLILYTIENYLNIPVFPDTKSAWHFDEKVSQDYLLKAIRAPIALSWVFWDAHQAEDWAANAQYPVVLKLSSGAGSSNVIIIYSVHELLSWIKKIFGKGVFPSTMNERQLRWNWQRPQTYLAALIRRIYHSASYIIYGAQPPSPSSKAWRLEKNCLYLQEFIFDNTFDTRITIIGDQAFGFRRYNRPGDFRASGSGLIDYEPQGIDLRCVELAFQISKQAGFQSMAYDFLFKQDLPVITEISYTFAAWAIEKCPGHWDRQLNWHSGHMWPQESQVDTFLNTINLQSSCQSRY
jgi:glutathione synthase/RimK-type ligase-like ATP-grasp enzyme